MEVIVLSTETQKKYTLQMQGNTLGALKGVLTENHINFSGMVFYEGRTKSELLADDSTLPEGAIIRLTKAEKKIRSGVDRKELYAIIKDKNLGEAIKAKFGKNFTQCKTDELAKFVDSQTKKEAPVTKKPEAPKPSKPAVEESAAGLTPLEAWIQQGIANGFIDDATARQITCGTRVSDMSSSDDSMFDFLNKK